jgi:hypothetical protein
MQYVCLVRILGVSLNASQAPKAYCTPQAKMQSSRKSMRTFVLCRPDLVGTLRETAEGSWASHKDANFEGDWRMENGEEAQQ